jgi:uncharacterized protein YdeI (YjbR/CyaY-like superfamily)
VTGLKNNRDVGVAELPELVVVDAAAWRAWLAEHHAGSAGVWLVLAKQATVEPTSLTYDQALEEALCFGWIDGQSRRRDEATYLQRFTPRRPRSSWSRRNVGIAERLLAEGLMHSAGAAEVERARADGRWDAAYESPRNIGVPEDLQRELDADPAAAEFFAGLDSQNRYAILYRLQDAKRAETRARRLREFVAMLKEGRKVYP